MAHGEAASGDGSSRLRKRLRAGAVFCALALAFTPGTGLAQGALSGADQLAADDPDARMLLEANELIYDFDNDVVSAEGDVEMYYQGYTLESDRVIYDQNTQRVFAQGNVRITEPDGNVVYADNVELTDDFREGFLQQLVVMTTEDSHFAAVSAERIEDNVTIFTQGIYTACEPCQSEEPHAPAWQIKAARIIHDQEEQVVYYEDASFELFGMPIAYVPYFSHPDPTVDRQSGFLAPEVGHSSKLGASVKVPYFFALAPNYDLTVASTGFTKQGGMGEFEWRHRLERGSYIVQGAGIHQLNPEEFPEGSPSDRKWRGFIRTAGEFEINDFWSWGFDGRLTTDPSFQRQYDFTDTIWDEYTTEYRNQLWLTGQSARNWFDARSIEYKSMSVRQRGNDFHTEDPYLPRVHPVIDYNYIHGEPVLGGQLAVDVNVLSLSRRQAEFGRVGEDSGACWDPERLASLRESQDLTAECDLLGAPGNVNRFVAEAQWETTMVDSLGQVFTPFASLRGDAYAVDIGDPYLELTGGESIVGEYIATGERTVFRGMPTVGLEYRWPFLFSSRWGYQIIEPMGQIIARPDEQKADVLPNEDAQSLVFDDTTLFARDKFSGYDRVEGGTRANVGVRYSFQGHNGVSAGGTFGQSYHLAGENPFPAGTGLETDRSDYVASAYVSPIPNVEVASRMRFDESDFSLMRHDLETRGRFGPVRARVTYSDISADPAAGFDYDRRELRATSSLQLDENWRVFGSGRIELDGPEPGSQWISNSLGLGYADECIAFALSYERRHVRDGDLEPDERITFRLNLRTLTEGEVTTSISDRDPY